MNTGSVFADSGRSGLNIEQRKRLTLAVELVAKPELLLFLGAETHCRDALV